MDVLLAVLSFRPPKKLSGKGPPSASSISLCRTAMSRASSVTNLWVSSSTTFQESEVVRAMSLKLMRPWVFLCVRFVCFRLPGTHLES